MIDRPGLPEVIRENICFFRVNKNRCIPQVPLSSQQFLFRTTPDLRIVFCDSRVGEILHFNPTDLLDRTLYHLITVEDCESLLRAHMMSKEELLNSLFV
ncbi:hypothetical protein ANCDUO_13404 [Ancylostoma duodenale]|uniref:PAS domain-containing protein n=1 Tax=Ancylostoma duodenale TaxID=51022 RepID=A0A0C2G622_9BILA|nr:hypothetical protein ANCDUO_13404 [Ancylostoma duodenale]